MFHIESVCACVYVCVFYCIRLSGNIMDTHYSSKHLCKISLNLDRMYVVKDVHRSLSVHV